MINVVYPFIKSKWDEIRYSLRSLEEHLEGEVRLFLISDYMLKWVRNINHIKSSRDMNPYKDTAQKLLLCMEELEDFVWMNDDTFFLKKTNINDIKNIKALPEFPGLTCLTPWTTRLHMAVNELRKQRPNKPIYNFCTHAPYYFETEKLKELICNVPHLLDRCSIETVYFNFYGPKEPEFTEEVLYITTSASSRVKKVHRYINCNDIGLTDKVKNYLATRFNKPSMYETPGVEDDSEIIEPEVIEIDSILVKYTGKKKGYKFGEFDFSTGQSLVPQLYAKYMMETYPQSFRRG